MKSQDKIIDGFRVKLLQIGSFIVAVPTQIGPRILFLAHKKKPDLNLFGILPELGIQTEEGLWKIYGGHRLWISPENNPRSYSLDNQPINIKISDDLIELKSIPETNNSIQKEIILQSYLQEKLSVLHRITNIGRWPIRMACWPITVMRKNGFAIIPFYPKKVDAQGLLPDRHISLWPYTDLSDKRLIFTKNYIFVRHVPSATNSIKVGTVSHPNWVGYWSEGITFVKEYKLMNEEYPDFGSCVEIYSSSNFLELETVGPLKTILPGETLEYSELWSLHLTGELTPDEDEVSEKLQLLIN